MEKIKSPYKKFRKLRNSGSERFIFSNLLTNQIMFQSTINTKEDYVSINYNSLDKHFNYGYRYQVKNNNRWENISGYKKIFVEFENVEKDIAYSFNHYEKSKKLFVIFSSSDANSKFNYFNSFKNINENKLFLCDEVVNNIKHQCSYYYGFNGDNHYEKKVISLIFEKLKLLDLSNKDVILVGSSKGGFASLYYLFKYEFGKAIVGSPTIYLGKQHYASAFGDKLIQNITGMGALEGSQFLDALIINEIIQSAHKPIIYYHVGKGENRYIDHAIPFKKVFDEYNEGEVYFDLGDYHSHSEVGKYFVEYLIKVLSDLKEEL